MLFRSATNLFTGTQLFEENSNTTGAFAVASPIKILNTNTTVNNWASLEFDTQGNIAAGIGAQNIDQTNFYATLNFFTRGSDGFQKRLALSSTGLSSSYLLTAHGTQFGGTAYSVAGTALPACAAGTILQRLGVSDATLATPGSAYVGSGTYTIAVECTLNSTGTAYAWIID